MKRFLLSLAAVVLVGASALAKEYTITMSEVTTFNEEKTSFTAEGFTFQAAKNNGSSALRTMRMGVTTAYMRKVL